MYHPYHFIPLHPNTHPAAVDMAAFEKGEVPHLTHDRYISESRGQRCFSGRLVCALETVSPLVIGGEHDDRQQPVIVKPFLLPDGQPAIPASSLRGLISSIAEAASNSALRVLSLHESDAKSRASSASSMTMVSSPSRNPYLCFASISARRCASFISACSHAATASMMTP